MNQEQGSKHNSKISISSLKSYNSGSMSLDRARASHRNSSLSKRESLIYVMSIESGRRSDDFNQILQQSSYHVSNQMPWNNRNSAKVEVSALQLKRRSSNEEHTQGHTCDCYPTCRGEECSCYSARTQVCTPDSCCETCIQMKNALLMADRGEFCHCKIGQCIKSTCKCMRNNGVCTSLCKCEGCRNVINSKERAEAAEHLKNGTQAIQEDEERKFCTCKKTKCNKKYCSCFANGIKCSKYCQCENCVNCDIVNQDPMCEERPPSIYKDDEFANIEMPDGMNFTGVDFTPFHK